MLKPAFSILAIAAMLTLTACSDKNDTSVQLDANDAVAASDAPVSGQTQTLNSEDGKISITTTNSQFSDQMANAERWVGTGEKANLALLQHDETSGITLSVSNLGAPKSSADDYFKQLTATLKNNNALQDLDVGAATENRMNYRFSHSQNDVSLSENCVAIYEPENLYIVCASSGSANSQQLADTLKNISIKQ